MKNIKGYEKTRKITERLGKEASIKDRKYLGRTYNRILTPEEKGLMDAESFGYLLSLYLIGTIDSIRLEKFIDHSLSIAFHERQKLSLERTKRIVNMLFFFEGTSLRSKDFVALFREFEEELNEHDVLH